MLSTARSFLFVHVPKTAGNSLQNVLQPYSDDVLVCDKPGQDGIERFGLKNERYPTQKHSTLDDYRRHYPDELFQGLYKFTVVRNTYERLISHFFSPHQGRTEWVPDIFCDFVKTQVHPLRHYLAFSGQSLEKGLGNLDCILRFEQLDLDFSDLCNKLGLTNASLPVRNKSRRLEFAGTYDDRILEIIHDHFREEIDYFKFLPPH